MSEFKELAESIAGRLMNGNIRIEEINSIVASCVGDVNCYPGNPTDICYPVAFFISLVSKKNKLGNGHLSLHAALGKIVNHLAGKCNGLTHTVILITDNWDPTAFEEWSKSLENRIVNGVRLEIYMLLNGRAIQIHRNGGGL